MFIWIVVAVVALGLAGWAFWPRRRGIADGEFRRAKRLTQGKVENYDNPGGPNFNGPF